MESVDLVEEQSNFDNRSPNFEHFISSIFDGEIYKQYRELKENKQIVLISLFSDGVPLNNCSSTELYPIFIKVHNLNCEEEKKIFLYSNFYGDGKPEIDFFFG